MSSALPVSRGPGLGPHQSAGDAARHVAGMVTQGSVARRVLGAWAGETERCCWGDGELLEDEDGWEVIDVDGEDYVEEKDVGGGERMLRVTGPIGTDVETVRGICVGLLLGTRAPLRGGLVCISHAIPPGGESAPWPDAHRDEEGDVSDDVDRDVSDGEEGSPFDIKPMRATRPRLCFIGMKLREMPFVSPRGALCVAMCKVTPGGKVLVSLRSVDERHDGAQVKAEDVAVLMPPGVTDYVPTRLRAALMLTPQTISGDGDEFSTDRPTTLYRYVHRTSGGGWFAKAVVDRGQGRALLRDLAALRKAAETKASIVGQATPAADSEEIRAPPSTGDHPRRVAGVPM